MTPGDTPRTSSRSGRSPSTGITRSGVSGNVRIELSRNGGTSWETLFDNTPNDGSQSWKVTGQATPTARIKVTSVNDSSVYDVSNGNFAIR